MLNNLKTVKIYFQRDCSSARTMISCSIYLGPLLFMIVKSCLATYLLHNSVILDLKITVISGFVSIEAYGLD